MNKKLSNKIIIIVILSLVFLIYVFTWIFRWQIGLISPMANLRYFSYTKITFSNNTYNNETKREGLDNFFYYLYYPLYSLNRWSNTQLKADDIEIHWSDRKDSHDIIELTN
jgi:hypothetical protein